MNCRALMATAAIAALAPSAVAEITVTIENTNPEGGFFLTPVWIGIHDGTFDTNDAGVPAAMFPGLTEIAEGGDTAPLSGALCSAGAGGSALQSTVIAPLGAGGAPVLDPGESTSFTIDEGDPTINRYFSFASMVIPSNDLFVANGDPMGHMLFDESGVFTGPIVIEIVGAAVNDNGTEVNDADGGAAFSANGGMGVGESGVIRAFFTDPNDGPYLDSFIGSMTANGLTITTPFTAGDVIARIMIEQVDPTPVRVRIENTASKGGFFLTPFWVGLHNAGFDSYDGGAMAAMFPGLTEIAEGGDTGPLSGSFCASDAGFQAGLQRTLVAVTGSGDAPVLNPGESTTVLLDSGDPALNRYFSYASMVIPSNDLFVANADPMAHAIFDANGLFNGTTTIEVLGGAVNDNGTEVNDAFGGAAFSANGGVDADESLPIRGFFTEEGDAEYLESFVGTQTVTGFTLTTPFDGDDLVARITVSDPVACPDDADGNHNVGVGDLIAVIVAFGQTGPSAADLNLDGVVDVMDLLSVIENWGPCV